MFIKKNKINLKNYKNNILIYFQIKKIITVKNSNTCQRLFVMEHCHHTISSKADMHLGSWPDGGRGLFSPAAPGFESLFACLSSPRCFTCLLGLQGVQLIVGLVVVRASWPGHSRK